MLRKTAEKTAEIRYIEFEMTSISNKDNDIIFNQAYDNHLYSSSKGFKSKRFFVEHMITSLFATYQT